MPLLRDSREFRQLAELFFALVKIETPQNEDISQLLGCIAEWSSRKPHRDAFESHAEFQEATRAWREEMPKRPRGRPRSVEIPKHTLRMVLLRHFANLAAARAVGDLTATKEELQKLAKRTATEFRRG